MRLTYLGTAAAEGFPAVFCRCPYCVEARRLGGKNIRTRSQALVDEELLIDLPADTYHHFLTHGIEGDRIPYLLLTHAHRDHLYPTELLNRSGAYAHGMRAPVLHVYATAGTCAAVGEAPEGVALHVLTPYEMEEVGPYRITALPARHMPGGDAVFYVIEGDKTLLYAHDTGYPTEEVLHFLRTRGFVFDMVSLDCTNIDIPSGDEGHHMDLLHVGRLLTALTDMGAITEKTLRYVNHFSHNGNPLHEPLSERARTVGCQVAYDGCTVDF